MSPKNRTGSSSNPPPARVVAIVAAGGVGKRLGRRLHKPFIRLNGRPMLVWTMGVLERCPSVEEIVVVAHRADILAVWRLARKAGWRKVTQVVAGGGTRTESVFRGLTALPAQARWVLIHDAARPLVTLQMVEETVKAAFKNGAAIAAVPVVPTVKEASGGWVTRTLNRDHLWAAQTPQVFRRDWLERAHERARARGKSATDDAALVEAMGRRVKITPGSSRNIKVTTPEDLMIAEALLKTKRGLASCG